MSVHSHRPSTAAAPFAAPPCGPVAGWIDGLVARFTGIPYARSIRFGAPSPAPEWTETFDATEWSAPCPQPPEPLMQRTLGSVLGDTRTDENCQRLSVTVPHDRRDGEVLPVMVWIHGGSFVIGAGDAPVMDPARLVAEQRVIAVTVTYRLGVFGFTGGTTGRPANLGLLDQLEALRWVQRNISAFGGDPARVTAFGQSAGGASVADLMTTPQAPTLFARAILQSTPLGITRRRSVMDAAVAAIAATATDEMTAEEVLAVQQRASAVGTRFGLRGGMPFGTRYGFAPLPAESDLDDALEAVAPHIEILIGHTSQEARLFVPPIIAKRLGKPAFHSLVTALTGRIYARPSRRFAQRHADACGRAHQYVISWSAPGNKWGSAHMADLPLLFGDEKTWTGAGLVKKSTWAELDAAGRHVRSVWGAFARGEDVGEGDVPGVLRWERVDSARR